MAELLPIRAFNRSQNVRINKIRVHSGITSFVDLESTTQKKEYSYHSAIGAVYPVGPIRTSIVAVVNGLVVSATSPASKKVTYSKGRVRDTEGNLHTVEEGTTAEFGAAASNPRIDLVEVKTDGSEVKIKKGTEAAEPKAPTVDAGFTVLAQVALAKEFAEVKQENITDVRTLS